MELNIIDLHARTDVTSLNNALLPVVTALTALLPLLPFLILLKGALLLGLLLKEKLGSVHGTPVYTQQLPQAAVGSYFNTRDHSDLHDLVPARLVHHVAAPPSGHRRRLVGVGRVDTGLVGVGRVDTAVLEDHATAQTEAKTYQQLMAELETAGPRPRPHTASGGFWDSLLRLG